MRFYSTEGRSEEATFREAIFRGYAPDGGVYVPKTLPTFSSKALRKLRGLSLTELGIEAGKTLFQEDLTPQLVEKVIEEAFNFPAPFFSFSKRLYLLELFHGPTLSFKDFGARFLARLMYRLGSPDKRVTVLVATSGDTGSAVGNAFLGLPGFRVFILYPKGCVTAFQKQQLTTLGGNITALEVEGGFEDCQSLLKQACLDPDLRKEQLVTTGNSINVGRIFAQALYYLYAYSQLPEHGPPALFSVPCGNFGHLVSGILAERMGLPVSRFIAATNINDEVPLFLKSGFFEPHPAYHTIAVSMDVGNPSNFPRLLALYDHSLEKMRQGMWALRFTDDEIREGVRKMFKEYGYVLDPHSATAYLALERYLKTEPNGPGIFFATAHPAKFQETLQGIVPQVEIPEKLRKTLEKPQQVTILPNHYEAFKDLLAGVISA